MDLKQLQYFVTIVDEGNISKAAKVLNMSQPPLSTQIHLLEQELNCTLFIRGSRSIQLTQEGKALYSRSISILNMADIARNEILDFNEHKSGTIRLGVVSSIGSTLLIDWIKKFNSTYPNIHFELFEANTYQLLENLKAGLIEAAIVRTPFNSSSFECTYLASEPMLAVGNSDYFNTSKISIRNLSQKPLIIYKRWKKVLDEIFHDYNITPNYFCINDDAKTTATWASNNLGVGILPLSAVSLITNPDITYKKIDEPRLDSTISIIRNKNGYISAIAKLFIEDIISNISL